MKKRFTLIELLICVAIIAILASLLLPVLARARYRARLVVCMNNQRQIATAVTAYTGEHDEYYPNRLVCVSGSFSNPNIYKGGGGDDRPLLNSVYPITELQCPFSAAPDLMDPSASAVLSTTQMFYGWSYAKGTSPMHKLGRNWGYGGNEFDNLLGDQIWYNKLKVKGTTAHPSTTGRVDLIDGYGTTFPDAIYLRWMSFNPAARFDSNYTRTDGSTFLIPNILGSGDPRLEKVPSNHGNDTSKYFRLCPSVDF